MTVEDRIHHLAEYWFLSEPALFAVFCTHKLTRNDDMNCMLRVGKGLLEYCPRKVTCIPEKELDQRLMTELIRILLKHPYGRQPVSCSGSVRKLGSDCVVKDHYQMPDVPMHSAKEFGLEPNETFEEYCRALADSSVPMPSDGTDDDSTELWQEDELAQSEINRLIQRTHDWGSIPGDMVEQIIASTKAKIDYQKVLQGFRASVLSTNRELTRMRPNRRLGFAQMGSKFGFSTRLLIAVDVSGSISHSMLENFFSVINKAFQYGFREIDVLQFDAEVKGEPITLKKAQTKIKVLGRGGTNFQPVIDYTAQKQYDGLLFMTDGDAPQPQLPVGFRTPILWVCTDENAYNYHQEWMQKLGRVILMEK